MPKRYSNASLLQSLASAVRAVAEWATKNLAKESFLYPVAVENIASRRIAEKLNGEIVKMQEFGIASQQQASEAKSLYIFPCTEARTRGALAAKWFI